MKFNLHKSSFKLEHKRTSTTLSDNVWKLKKKTINYKVCGLCLQEKLSILRSAPSLNKRSEIFGHCFWSQIPGLYSRQIYAVILSVLFKSFRTFDIKLLAWITSTGCHKINDSPLASRLSETRDADISSFLIF